MQHTIFTKGFAFAVIVLFVGMSAIPSTSITDLKKSTILISYDGNTLYVGGSGPGNYTKIQDAIDNASDGDIVFVYSGIYNENVLVNKSINLVGEDRNTTLIHGNEAGDVVYIYADQVDIRGFTILNSGNSGRDSGIEIRSDHNTVSDNIILNNTIGIFVYYSTNNAIFDNVLLDNNDYGIHLYTSNNNTISDNVIYNNRWGIFFLNSSQNNIKGNTIKSNRHYGIWFSSASNSNTVFGNTISLNDEYGLYSILKCSNNNISGNTFSKNNGYGVYFDASSNNDAFNNNFLENECDAYFTNCKNLWGNNFWNKSRRLPKLIFGFKYILPWINVDWHPAREPYDIPSKNIVMPINIQPGLAEIEDNIESTSLPDSFDWRDINGTDYTTPIKNQFPAPTCEAYALCAAAETLVQYQVGYPFGCDLSDVHLYFYSGGTVEAGGVNVQEAAEYLLEYGVPDEGCFPDPHRPYDYPFESLPGWENRIVKIEEWGWIENDIDSIKRALVEHGPLVIHMLIRTDFLYYTGGIYTPRIYYPVLGCHLMTLIGYDDNQEYWIVKNSIDENWGEEGYIRVSYGAHTPSRPFIFPGYGGTGILYIDGVYGAFMQDAPKIQIEYPEIYHTYFFGREIPALSDVPTTFRVFRKRTFIQEAAPRIIGGITIRTNATNAEKVGFYIDDELKYVDECPPYEWRLNAGFGLHTIETLAHNKKNMSKATIDVFVLV
ncbi:MAG: right-handed parallel beta-helix repeat-containing protein [Thermoplasmatales archaeon]|nr:MAG: right-handed parallel beta-helix repeat-containing protein [Thermoplasmatales archaeon]